MGYMGFGLNKWVYKQRPRKFFSRERKPVGDTIPKHENNSVYNTDKPQLTGRLNEHQSADEIADKSLTKRTNKIYRVIIYCTLLAITLIAIVNYNKKNESRQASAQARYEKVIAREKQEEVDAYKLIYDYGMNSLEKKDYKSAIKEFEHLVYVQAHDLKANITLANALYLYCIEENKECDRALLQYKKLSQLNNTSLYQQRTVDIYMHLGLYEQADSVLNRMK